MRRSFFARLARGPAVHRSMTIVGALGLALLVGACSSDSTHPADIVPDGRIMDDEASASTTASTWGGGQGGNGADATSDVLDAASPGFDGTLDPDGGTAGSSSGNDPGHETTGGATNGGETATTGAT